MDRYAIYDAVASGGMATVHLGRLIGTAGFLRTVAIKRLHSQYANDPEFTAMFLDEARLASRIQHPNVVSTLDVVMKEHELLLVMEYVRGESLSRLVRRARDRGERLPPEVVVAIVAGALHGLHAAHEARDEKGQPLGLVHRDMTPQNILVGTDGIARVLDFGVAKAAGRLHTTRDGDIKGKVLYMSPEQLAAQPLTRTADIYAAGVVLFEALTCVRMFAGDNEGAALSRILKNEITLPSAIAPELAPFDAIVRRASAASSNDRYPTAREMAVALEATCGAASASEVGAWVERLAGELLDERARIVAEIERSSTRSRPPLPLPSSKGMKIEPQVATVTGVAPVVMQDRAPARSVPLVALVAMGVLLLGTMTVSAVLINRAGAKPAADTPPTAAAKEPTNVVTAAVARRPDTPASAASEPAADAPQASSAKAPPPPPSATTAPSTSATTSTTPTAASSTRKAGGPPVGARVNCDPPYVVDKNGHQHFIPECLK